MNRSKLFLKTPYGDTKVSHQSFRKCLAGLFLAIFSFLQLVQVFHTNSEIAEHEVAHCTLEQESNHCHVSIVHGDDVNGCKHKQHLTETSLECQLCDMLATRHDPSIQDREIFTWCVRQHQNNFTHYLPTIYLESNRSHPHRGPPHV